MQGQLDMNFLGYSVLKDRLYIDGKMSFPRLANALEFTIDLSVNNLFVDRTQENLGSFCCCGWCYLNFNHMHEAVQLVEFINW